MKISVMINVFKFEFQLNKRHLGQILKVNYVGRNSLRAVVGSIVCSYAYWTDKENSTTTNFTYYQIDRKNHSIRSQHSLEGRLRALHSTLSTYRLGLLVEHASNSVVPS